MIKEIFRKHLEIRSVRDLHEQKKPSNELYLELTDPKDFQLNKFLYKQVGKKYRWVDRLEWTEEKWISYVGNKNILTYVLKEKENIVGFFELFNHKDVKEVEITYFGILEEFFGKKIGAFLLTEAIKKSFSMGAARVWCHTCSLDHENALKNYLSRGMKIFKSEIFKI